MPRTYFETINRKKTKSILSQMTGVMKNVKLTDKRSNRQTDRNLIGDHCYVGPWIHINEENHL